MEKNRSGWSGVENELPRARITRAWGWQIPTWRKSGEFSDRRYIHFTPGLIWQLLRFHPDVVIANEMGFRTVVALAYGTLARKPVWVWWGGTLHTERNTGPARRALRALVSRWARRWISYGMSSTEYLRSLGIARENILEIQNAVNEQLFAAVATGSPASEAGTALVYRTRPVVLCVSALIPRKGIDCLLHAAIALQRGGREFSLVVVGSGPDGPALEQLAQDMRLKNVHFHAERRPEEMPAVYRSADVFVFPTLEDVWGMVANEAVLSGLPVLCSKYAGCAGELFDAGNIFDPQDPEDFKEKLRAALDGRIAKSDPRRLRTTPMLAGDLIRALEESLPSSAGRAPDEAMKMMENSAR